MIKIINNENKYKKTNLYQIQLICNLNRIEKENSVLRISRRNKFKKVFRMNFGNPPFPFSYAYLQITSTSGREMWRQLLSRLVHK